MLKPMKYSEMKWRLEELAITEDPNLTKSLSDNGEVRSFSRDMMGVGTPDFPVIYRNDDSIVHVPTLKKLLQTLGVKEQEFMAVQRTPATE